MREQSKQEPEPKSDSRNGKVSIGDTVNYVTTQDKIIKAKVIAVMLPGNGKKPVLNITIQDPMFNGKLKEVHTIQHQKDRIPDAREKKISCWY